MADLPARRKEYLLLRANINQAAAAPCKDRQRCERCVSCIHISKKDADTADGCSVCLLYQSPHLSSDCCNSRSSHTPSQPKNEEWVKKNIDAVASKSCPERHPSVTKASVDALMVRKAFF